ncbi:MAG TPA: hypothetical protein V6C76_10480 [Drouetiella sp.]
MNQLSDAEKHTLKSYVRADLFHYENADKWLDLIGTEDVDAILQDAEARRYERMSLAQKWIACIFPSSSFRKKTIGQEIVGYATVLILTANLVFYGVLVWQTNGLFLLAFRGLLFLIELSVLLFLGLWLQASISWSRLNLPEKLVRKDS